MCWMLCRYRCVRTRVSAWALLCRNSRAYERCWCGERKTLPLHRLYAAIVPTVHMCTRDGEECGEERSAVQRMFGAHTYPGAVRPRLQARPRHPPADRANASRPVSVRLSAALCVERHARTSHG
ncbi:hypothetical protein JIQ42_07888 [Leishmania sp. Namibia]|uniref:hypothetical protein n=1 Tax=Leishmania sp. Namibia TaxID=2802991 RepID=UPI001B60AC50|nr:hypothetical protein JIQ42_07888 [Leishmania sp. Namibia]